MSASFALQTALQAAIKSCGASCGAILSFWDPDGAALSSVEILESNTKFQHTIVSAPITTTTTKKIEPSSPPPATSRNKINFDTQQMKSSLLSHSVATNAPAESTTVLITPPPILNESPTPTISHSTSRVLDQLNGPAKNPTAIQEETASPERSQSILPAPASSFMNQPQNEQEKEEKEQQQQQEKKIPKIPPPQLQRSTAQLAFSYRCVAVSSNASTIFHQNSNRASTTSTTAASKKNAASISDVSMLLLSSSSGTPAKKAQHLHHHQQQQQLYVAAHNTLLNKALNPAVIQAAATSGIAIHCCSPSSPYLVVPILSRKSHIDAVYSAATRRLLDAAGPGGSLAHMVVVGVLVLVGFPVVDQDAAAKALEMLEGRGDSTSASTKMMMMSNNNNKSSNKNNDGVSGGELDNVEQAFEQVFSAKGKTVSFRAEEETIAATLARTVLSEIMSTPEGVIATEKNMANYLASCLIANPSPSSEKPISSTVLKKFVGASKLAVQRSKKISSSNEEASMMMMSSEKNEIFNNNLIENNSSSSYNNNITQQNDFHRSTRMRRIPEIIRIPDSSIFLSQRGLSKNKTSEFQALPDLPEVKKIIENAELAMAMLREQNISLHNVLNTKSNFVTTSSMNSGKFMNNNNNNEDQDENNNNNNPSNEDLHSDQQQQQQATATNRRITIQEGMEKLEKKIAALRRENISLRNHVELLTHRLESVTSRKSIQSVAAMSMLASLEEHHQHFQNQEEIPSKTGIWGDTFLFSSSKQQNNNNNNNFRPKSSSSSSTTAPSPMNFTPRPPTSSSSSFSHQNNSFPLFKAAHDVLSRPLPASVLLEVKAVEGLDKLKKELANRSRSSSANGKSRK
jgi:hypothetical protein